jgi:hypothetical protein
VAINIPTGIKHELMKRPKRLTYNFSEESSDHYYKFYFQKKHIDEEDNIAILLEIICISLNTEKSWRDLKRCSDLRIKLFEKTQTPFEFVLYFFNGPGIHSVTLYSKEYYKIFDEPCTKKILWDDLVYKLKFKHLHPDLDFNFPNPYENSDEVIF